MKDEQKLYPQLIYRINSKLSELKIASGIIDGEGNKTVGQIVAPSVFNPYGRNFHWLVVADDKWEFSEGNDGWFGNIITHIQENKEKWKEFKKKYATNEDKIEIKSIEDVFEILDNTAYNENDNEKEKKEKRDKYHHALLTVFQFYPVVSHKYIDGIIYRNLKRLAEKRADKALSSHKIDYAIANLLIFDENKEKTFAYKDTYKLYPWAQVKFQGSNPETKYSCQENNSKEEDKYPEDPDIDKNEIAAIPIFPSSSRNRNPAVVGTDSFFHNYFLPFFAGYEDFKTEAFLELKPEHFNKFKHIVIVPLYDAYIGGKYYGNLCGTLQIPFKAEEEKNQKESNEPRELTEFKQNNLEKLISNSHLLTSEIKESAIFEVLQQPISTETDLLEHFIKYITFVQDWERIMVWNKNSSSFELDYCYKRDNDNKWDRCPDSPDRNMGKMEKCAPCKSENEKSYFGELKAQIGNDKTTEEYFKKKNVKRKAFLENILNKKLIPELYDDVINKHKNTRLIFEYPCYTVFPEDESSLHKLGIHYERQQIDILRQMFLQERIRREIVKHGTNSAVAAIMGRNMDHNIGSHVLSYLVSEYREDMEDIAKLVKFSDKELPLKCFILNNRYLLKYLKDRMDFIATILTFTPSCTTLNFLQDVIGDTKEGCEKDVLNYGMQGDKLFEKFRDNNKFKYFRPKNLILDYIAFSEKLKEENISREKIVIKFSNVLTDNENKLLKGINVALPGGVVGKQAFYVIMENIIRNAAKHGTKNHNSLPDRLEFTINFPDERSLDHKKYDKDELIRITITDNLNNGSIAEELQKKCELPLIKEDGSLDRQDLGIKEKKIAAAFLRGCSPSSIEGNKIKDWQFEDDSKDILKITNSSRNLQYSFFLLKPKEILIITDNLNGIDHTKYKKEGIDFVITKDGSTLNGIMTVEELRDRYKKTKLRHRFLLIVNGNENILDDFDKDYLPYRIVNANNNEIEKEPIELIKWVCEEWLKKYKNSEHLPSLVFHYNNIHNSWNGLYTKYDEWNGNENPVCIYFQHFETKVNEFIGNCKNTAKLNCENLLDCMKKRNVIHMESITGGNSSKYKIDDPQKPPIMKWEFIEAGLTKVLIIDERLFNIAANGGKIELLKAKGIEIWDLKETGNELIFESLPVNPQNDEIKLEQKNRNLSIKWAKHISFDCIAIHQGIIDKILDRKKLKKSKENINNILNELKDLGKFKCVHSGRGKTEEIPEGWRFLNYPELESWFFDDKHTLVQGLFSLRGR